MNFTIWLKVEARKKHQSWAAGSVSAFKTKPSTTENEIALRLNLEIPDSIFEEPIYEARLVLPNTTRKLPEMAEIERSVGDALSKQMGFRVKVSMPPPKEEE